MNRKNNKRILPRLKKFAEQVYEIVPSAIFTVDRNQKITSWNRRAQEILGYAPAEVIGKKCFFFALLPCTHICGVFAKDVKKPIIAKECTFKTKDGRILTVVKNADLLTEDGKIVGAVESFEDVTQRKIEKAELEKYRDHLEQMVKEKTQEIQDSAKQLKALFDDARDGILLADIGSKKFLLGNKAICEMLGYTPEELKELGNKCLMGNFRDITERKLANDALKQALEAKTVFTSMVSHELRTPLSALKESISQILDGLLGVINEDQRRFLEIAKRNVDRLSRLINEILDFQKIETGKMVFNMEFNDINEVVKETKETMEIVARQKRLNIVLDLANDLPRLKFDRDKISQVLSNLVNNSLKVMQKGQVTISTGRMNGQVLVAVKDTGPGIKKEDLPRLFHQYEQLDRKPGGTGLGLAISAQIVQAHGGKIWAESPVGQGAIMSFNLPVQ